MKNLNEILRKVIQSDAVLHGFAPESLPQAAKARVANTIQSLESRLEEQELQELEKWIEGIFEKASFQASENGDIYYVFPDDSLYFSCGDGDSEVWTFAPDFAIDRIINNGDAEITGMDAELLLHLGYEQEIENRKAGRSATSTKT